MTTSLQAATTLHNGVKMPWLGLGVWKMNNDEEVVNAVRSAIDAGYRSIDTAMIYRNEEGVGQAVKASGVPRDELFVTTKIWNEDQGYDKALKAFEDSKRRLGLDYVDLLLIHWPGTDKFVDTWRALERLYADGQVRAVGVSNFKVRHLQELAANSPLAPMVNQVEFHPLLTQQDTLAYCRQHGIQLEAWSPLMQGNLDQPLLRSLADKYGKSPAQIVLRWDLQKGVVTIPKSSNPQRIAENADIFDFSLTDEEVGRIEALNEERRFGADPDTFLF
ncbi:aldo/keto reductase [Cohnella nanjingensis]|uniref:Aldo/keto reductase n=1 Tax=Cohnella nanjingensis TaxID=1387779 RepID=A0A7X0VHD5_9BACL|nr:aldo/keto reductase [Cohnella nanjingensis]MBB6673373.1 aldo/keto reductase [Cohnella nanjingensis]